MKTIFIMLGILSPLVANATVEQNATVSETPKISLQEAVGKAVQCSPAKPGDKSGYGVYYVGGASFSPIPEKIDGKMVDRHWKVTITSSGVGEGALHFIRIYEDGRCEYSPGI